VGGSARDKSGTFHETKEKLICLPEDPRQNGVELVVRMKIGEDLAVFPRDRELPAVSVIVAVLTKQFACGTNR